jgi:DNA-binding response OmpR family regulator
MHRILIVEDDTVIAKTLKNNIELWGYEAEYITDFKDVLTQFVSYEPQLILLDISLPFYNGYHWCSEIRKVSKIPIMFLSSASDNMNIVMAMNMGGDDFIPKPFDLNVLIAKVQAMLRRTYDFAGQSHLVEHKGAILNTSDATLTYEGNKIDLTKNDFKILQILMENKGRAVSREAIMTRLWETDSYVDENTLTVNMTRLRKKLEAEGLKDYIITKKGIGYLME